jgi:hypothetical protein
MTKPDAALLLLGAWLLGIAAMAAVALVNFGTVDRLLTEAPNATFSHGAAVLDARAEAPSARDFLRFLVSELNRTFFWQWGLVEAAIGAVLTLLVWPQGGRVRSVVVAMWMLTLLLTFGITPPIVSVGRALDFVPRDPAPPELSTFGLLHAAYTMLDGVKLALGFVAAFWISKRWRPAN